MIWDVFTITLADGSTITEAPKADGPDSVSIESFGVEIHDHYATNRIYIPWHQVARVDTGEAHRESGAR